MKWLDRVDADLKEVNARAINPHNRVKRKSVIKVLIYERKMTGRERQRGNEQENDVGKGANVGTRDRVVLRNKCREKYTVRTFFCIRRTTSTKPHLFPLDFWRFHLNSPTKMLVKIGSHC